MGPELVGSDEIPDPGALHLTLTIDGEVMQSADTCDTIFDVPTMVAYMSELVALEPGDCIAMGTPGGVGQARDPKRFLQPGERVCVEIDGIGALENPVTEEAR